jgi:hypothetical protein
MLHFLHQIVPHVRKNFELFCLGRFQECAARIDAELESEIKKKKVMWGFWAGPGLVWMGCVVFAAALLWGGRLLAAGHQSSNTVSCCW